MAEAGVGLAYVVDLDVAESLERGTLRLILDEYAVRVPGAFLYYPSRQASPALRAFIEMLLT